VVLLAFYRAETLCYRAFIQLLRTLDTEAFRAEEAYTVQVSWSVTHSMLYGEELKQALNQARINLATVRPPEVIPNVKEL
jgi:hypothetical protein